MLFFAVILLAFGYLLVYSGWTSRSVTGELKSVFSGRPVAK